MNSLFLRVMVLLMLLSIPFSYPRADEDISIDGTYVLEFRVLSDGEVIKPPELIGLYNLDNGYANLNIVERNKENKVHSVTIVAKYKLSSTEFNEERLFFMINDEIGNKGIKYGFEKSGTSPVKLDGGKIEFVYPINNDIHASFQGDSFKASRIDGTYIDTWKKIK